MPRLTDIQKDQIRQSLILCYQQQFGPTYQQCFHKNLSPNPVPALAQQYGVSQYQVQKIHTRIKMVGYMTRPITPRDLNLNPL